LLVLLAMAAWVWWLRHREGGASRKAMTWRWGKVAMPTDMDSIHLVASARLDINTRLHVVEWRGGQLLLGVGASSPPVVLDRSEAPLLASGERKR
jgi:hypothetical protein